LDSFSSSRSARSCSASARDSASSRSARSTVLDRMHHRADAFRELPEQRELRLAEALERRELEHRLDFAAEQQRLDDHVERRHRAEHAAHPDVIARHVVDQDRLSLLRSLAD
jgi:hypothetical protein